MRTAAPQRRVTEDPARLAGAAADWAAAVRACASRLRSCGFRPQRGLPLRPDFGAPRPHAARLSFRGGCGCDSRACRLVAALTGPVLQVSVREALAIISMCAFAARSIKPRRAARPFAASAAGVDSAGAGTARSGYELPPERLRSAMYFRFQGSRCTNSISGESTAGAPSGARDCCNPYAKQDSWGLSGWATRTSRCKPG